MFSGIMIAVLAGSPMQAEPDGVTVELADFYRFGSIRPGAKCRSLTLKEWSFMSEYGGYETSLEKLGERLRLGYLLFRLSVPDSYLSDVTFTFNAWDCLDNVAIHIDDGDKTSALSELARLQRILGPLAYANGQMPSTDVHRRIDLFLRTAIQ